jgi:hypothetical protein
MSTTPKSEHHGLLRNLARELFQTEVSASRHSRREAQRLEGTPPAAALVAVAEHADRALAELKELARAEDLPVSAFGSILGEAFSQARERIADRLLEGERSYRATLLGMRHGVDAVRMFGLTAKHAQRSALSDWAGAWTNTRTPLVQEVERQLEWFAEHIEHARKLAR